MSEMKLIAAITLGLFVAGCDEAYAQSGYYTTDTAPEKVTLAAGHGPLAAENGMTLYIFDKDSTGVSNCYDSCAVSWPPYLAESGAAAPGADFSTVERRDGTQQWAKNGAPLYFWVGDTAPGDTNGDGVGGVWHIVQ
jgi:predicted lipoprotein with Yx(FWY)xxD motif